MDKSSIISLLLRYKIASIDEIEGCSEDEVRGLEREAGYNFPGGYRQFLLNIGRRAGLLFQGTDIFYPSIIRLTQEACELLQENQESFVLHDDVFVFSMHQGYEFCYFKFSDGGDPPIYQYVEGQGGPKLTWASFDAYLLDGINMTMKL